MSCSSLCRLAAEGQCITLAARAITLNLTQLFAARLMKHLVGRVVTATQRLMELVETTFLGIPTVHRTQRLAGNREMELLLRQLTPLHPMPQDQLAVVCIPYVLGGAVILLTCW